MKWTEPMDAVSSAGKTTRKLDLNLKEVLTMNRRMRSYYYAILGAIGGLIGSAISDWLGLSFTGIFSMNLAIVGALIGLLIGLFVGLTEGALTRNPVQALKSGLFGGLFGLVAGAVGLLLSEFLFQSVGAGIPGRALGWGIF